MVSLQLFETVFAPNQTDQLVFFPFSLSLFITQKKHSQMPLTSGVSNEQKDTLSRIAFSKTVILKLFHVFGWQPAVVSRYKAT